MCKFTSHWSRMNSASCFTSKCWQSSKTGVIYLWIWDKQTDMDNVFHSRITTAKVMYVKEAHRYAQMTRQLTKSRESNLSPTRVNLLPAAISLPWLVLVVAVQKGSLMLFQEILKCLSSSSNNAAKNYCFFGDPWYNWSQFNQWIQNRIYRSHHLMNKVWQERE